MAKRERLSAVFQALADDTRLRVIKLLEGGELCVCQITAALDMPQPKASFHLRVLRSAGLVQYRKQGRWGHYRIEDREPLRRFLIMSVLERIDCPEVKADRKRLRDFKGPAAD